MFLLIGTAVFFVWAFLMRTWPFDKPTEQEDPTPNHHSSQPLEMDPATACADDEGAAFDDEGAAFTPTRYECFDPLRKFGRGASNQLALKRYTGNFLPVSLRSFGGMLRAWLFAAAPSLQATTLPLMLSLLTTYAACALDFQGLWTSRPLSHHPRWLLGLPRALTHLGGDSLASVSAVSEKNMCMKS